MLNAEGQPQAKPLGGVPRRLGGWESSNQCSLPHSCKGICERNCYPRSPWLRWWGQLSEGLDRDYTAGKPHAPFSASDIADWDYF